MRPLRPAIFALGIMLASQPALSETREQSARRIFVKTVTEFNKSRCGDIKYFRLSILMRSMASRPLNPNQKTCVEAYQRAALAFDSLLEKFPETQVAFSILNEGYPTSVEIVPMITLMKELTERSAQETNQNKEKRSNTKSETSAAVVVTMSEIDAIRHRIEQCWNIPANTRGISNTAVSIRIWVNPDGTVREARILDFNRMSDGTYRITAESALRAVLNPRCSPLPIPPGKFEQFKEMILDFNPGEVAGN